MKAVCHFLLLFLFALPPATPAQARLPVLQERTPFPGSFLFTPGDGHRHPPILLLHGSEGGSVRNLWVHALLLAESGFTVMTFCWFDCQRDVRSEPMALMADVDLDKTAKAAEWLRTSPRALSGKGIALYGISKGAEQAMVLASLSGELPFQISALALHSPTDIIEPGFNINWLDHRCWICPKGVKDCRFQAAHWNKSCGKIDGEFKAEDRDTLPMWRWKGKRLPLRSRIEIEKYKGPVLITGGSEDSDWLSPKGRVPRIEEALKNAGLKPQVHLFPGEEHSFSLENEQKRKEIVDKFLHEALK